ncbi:MAG: hypothetical protein CM1200mP15_06180 [Dehalococcoidia bacterium]|nr:MAG: hypothetical protein CM1200mP15_06180 [Dehalococcoidia bacterium]
MYELYHRCDLIAWPTLLDFFSDAAVANTEVRHAMDKVTVQATEITSVVSSNPCTVSLVLNDGKTLENKVDFARGQPEFPFRQRRDRC